jgi:hypothetical protein
MYPIAVSVDRYCLLLFDDLFVIELCKARETSGQLADPEISTRGKANQMKGTASPK